MIKSSGGILNSSAFWCGKFGSMPLLLLRRWKNLTFRIQDVSWGAKARLGSLEINRGNIRKIDFAPICFKPCESWKPAGWFALFNWNFLGILPPEKTAGINLAEFFDTNGIMRIPIAPMDAIFLLICRTEVSFCLFGGPPKLFLKLSFWEFKRTFAYLFEMRNVSKPCLLSNE